MKHDPRLESYLTKMEDVLKPFPVSDRAEILTEIKSHVLSALERDPAMPLDTVLAALGEPETVANRYLLERGLQTTKPPISPIVKWVVVGFLGTLAMFLLFAGYVISHFSPLIDIDGAQSSISLLGGKIHINGDNVQVSKGNLFSQDSHYAFEGNQSIAKGQSLTMEFHNGVFNLKTSSANELSWKCASLETATEEPAPEEPAPEEPAIENKKTTLALRFQTQKELKCDVAVPGGVATSISGDNGKIRLRKVAFNTSAEIKNGKIDIDPDTSIEYRYSISVGNGKSDRFESSNTPGAIPITVRVANGKVSNSQ